MSNALGISVILWQWIGVFLRIRNKNMNPPLMMWCESWAHIFLNFFLIIICYSITIRIFIYTTVNNCRLNQNWMNKVPNTQKVRFINRHRKKWNHQVWIFNLPNVNCFKNFTQLLLVNEWIFFALRSKYFRKFSMI